MLKSRKKAQVEKAFMPSHVCCIEEKTTQPSIKKMQSTQRIRYIKVQLSLEGLRFAKQKKMGPIGS